MTTNVPAHWNLYLIPDLKTWSTSAPDQQPIESYNTFSEAKQRFSALRSQPYNREPNDLNPNGEPYARLTLGIESQDGRDAVDILQVRGDMNMLIDDFTRFNHIREDAGALRLITQIASEIGFDRVKVYMPEGRKSPHASRVLPLDQWDSPYRDAVFHPQDAPDYAARFAEMQGDAYLIYRLKQDDTTRELRFEPYRHVEDRIDKANYQPVYAGALQQRGSLSQQLEELFHQFNMNRPADFKGHSLSMSDVIIIRRSGVLSSHYVDSFSFVELPGFDSGKNPLRALEDGIEQNDNQLDGIINNLPDQQKPEARQSITERLQAVHKSRRDQPQNAPKPPVKCSDLER